MTEPAYQGPTHAQWEACRMLIARLRSEAVQEEFELEQLGIDWIAPEDVVCANLEDGQQLRIGDVLYASIMLIWSLVLESAETEGVHPLEVVARLGIGLANIEP